MKKINGDEPATQADRATWGGRLTERIDELRTQMEGVESRMATKDDLAKLERRMDKKLDTFQNEIIRHFDVVAENIHQDVAGANRDEISSLKDTDTKLHERVTVIEDHLDISTPLNS